MTANRKRFLLLLSVLIGFFVLYSMAVLLRHLRLESFGYDLGIFTQEVYSLASLKLPLNTIKMPNMIIWGDHWTVSLVFLTPFFWIFGKNAVVILITQVLFVIMAAYFIFKLSFEKTKQFLFSLALVIGFLLFFGTQNALFFDVHPIVFGASLLPLLFFLVEKDKWPLFVPLSFIIANFKEDLSIIIALVFFTFFLNKKKKLLLGLSFFYLLWFLAVRFYFLPYFSPGGYLYSGQSINITAIINFFNSYQKLLPLILPLSAFIFLPILNKQGLFLSTAILVENFTMAIGHYGKGWLFDRHYWFTMGVVMALGTISGYCNLCRNIKKKQLIKFLPALLLSSVLLFQYFFHLQLNMLTKKEYWNLEKHATLQEIQKQIPATASLATQNNLAPHFAARPHIYLVQLSGQQLETGRAEYLLLDLTPGQPIVNFYGIDQKRIESGFKKLIQGGRYKIIWQKQAFFLAHIVNFEENI